MIAIIDYGLGNLASIKNMLKRVDVKDMVITNDIKTIEKADKIILPGVGAFDKGMSYLQKHNLIPILNYKALDEKVPFLGVCLGMQLMTQSSEEGLLGGLGWFDAVTKKFSADTDLKVPHMGWNFVEEQKNNYRFKPTLGENPRFYFVHSYYVEAKKEEDVFYKTFYGQYFHSGLIKDNLIGLQFHPEKSLRFGMEIFKEFSKI
jgi:glutamine amidotransferase